MKKIIPFIVIIAAVFSLSASAASLSSDKLNIVIDGGLEPKYAAPGELVTVTLSLKGNKGLCSLWAKLTWSEKLELQDAKYEYYDENDDSAMVSFPEDGAAWNTVGNSFIFNWIWANKELKEDGAFVTMTFKVSDSAAAGEFLSITAEVDDDNLFNTEYENVGYNLINGGVTVGTEATGTNPAATDSGAVTTTEQKENGVNVTAIIIAVVAGVVVAAALITVIIISKRKKA